jgi:hypothetical protein
MAMRAQLRIFFLPALMVASIAGDAQAQRFRPNNFPSPPAAAASDAGPAAGQPGAPPPAPGAKPDAGKVADTQ